MQRVLAAFGRAAASQLHPKMLSLLVVPFVLAIVFWVLTAYLVWTPLTEWLQGWLFGGGFMASVAEWAAGYGLKGLREWIPALIALLLVVPVMFATAVVLIAVFAMPVVIRHLGGGAYRDVERIGSLSVAASGWNAASASLLFVAGYLLTLPLWLIPPLALVVPWLWWSWLTARVMRFDSLVEHADVRERKAAIASRRREYFVLALLVTALNYIPPLFLITPVLSALAFSHYSLALLREQRAAPPAASA
ncbi:MAG TPA: EI24 domain-containing protein [Burkholderiaceae bacterium]|nr:EI24 domain-containing protein [Burkholderiaceae bacterium]